MILTEGSTGPAIKLKKERRLALFPLFQLF